MTDNTFKTNRTEGEAERTEAGNEIITITCATPGCRFSDRYIVAPDQPREYLASRMHRDEWTIEDGQTYCYQCCPGEDEDEQEGVLTNNNRREWMAEWLKLPITNEGQDGQLTHFHP